MDVRRTVLGKWSRAICAMTFRRRAVHPSTGHLTNEALTPWLNLWNTGPFLLKWRLKASLNSGEMSGLLSYRYPCHSGSRSCAISLLFILFLLREVIKRTITETMIKTEQAMWLGVFVFIFVLLLEQGNWNLKIGPNNFFLITRTMRAHAHGWLYYYYYSGEGGGEKTALSIYKELICFNCDYHYHY